MHEFNLKVSFISQTFKRNLSKKAFVPLHHVRKRNKGIFFYYSFLQVLSKANIEMVLKFALEKKLFIFADEVG